MLSLGSLYLRASVFLERISAAALHRYGLVSYSQEGEDMILRRLFETQQCGFYVDVGAHHPQRFSNTYYFYRHGWSGINIDAAPGSMKLFDRLRPRDINVEAAIDKETREIPYFMFNEPALNTFDEKLAESKNKTSFRIEKTVKLRTTRLKDLLDEYLPAGQTIDFISIDVEGFDLNVLESNDWVRYRPHCIIVESLDMRLSSAADHPIFKFLAKHRYELLAKSLNSLIFAEAGWKI